MIGRVPRYHRIAESLRARIRRGELSPRMRLPNQRQLAREFGVTLMTLRQALMLLEGEQLIERRHGLGTFVAPSPIDYDILQLRRFAGDLRARGEEVGTRVLDAGFVGAERRAAFALRVAPGARVFRLDRLRVVGGQPTSLQRSLLPARIGDEVVKFELDVTPLHEILELKLGIAIVRARESVSAVRLPRRAARQLGCRPGIAAFESARVSYAVADEPIVFDHVFIPGDRFRITREFRYEGASS